MIPLKRIQRVKNENNQGEADFRMGDFFRDVRKPFE